MNDENARIRAEVLAWYRAARRDLPWRRSRDPYAIWVSEIMLQQTTVAAVNPCWQRFLELFPDVPSLARATEEELLSAWSGLGYYRRVRNMQRAARALVEAGQMELPASHEALLALPGIGTYTAAAVGSIAFGIPEPVVDGNVIRVLTRLDALEGDPTRQPVKRSIEQRARELLDADAPGDFNQALMELGATVCMPRRPRCLECPWSARCRARMSGDPTRFPELPERRRHVPVVRASLYTPDGEGRFLLHRIPEGEPNAGFWEPPTVTLHDGNHDRGRPPARWSSQLAARAEDALRERFEIDVEIGSARARCKHGITHHRIWVHLVEGALRAPLPCRDDLAWVDHERRGMLPLSTIARKLLS